MRRTFVLCVAALLSLCLMSTVGALWLATSNLTGAAAVHAHNLSAGTQPTATVTPAGGSDVVVSWAASTGGTPPLGYEVHSYDAVTGAPRAVGSACAGVIADTTCTETGVAPGTWRYSVVPRLSSWSGAESPQSAAIVIDTDVTPPTVAITFPEAASSHTPATWDAGCSSQICGTADDTGSGVTSVSVSIRQGAGNYWDGTSFASASEVLLPATGTTSWTLGFPSAGFPEDGSYVVHAVATDGVGSTGSMTETVTIDSSAPAAPLGLPVDGAASGAPSETGVAPVPEPVRPDDGDR